MTLVNKMKILFKDILNSKGFTLAEGMVTAGLLGVVSLAMLQGIKEDSKTKAYARINDEVQTIMSAINNSVKDTTACSASLTGVVPVSKSATPTNTVANIKSALAVVLKSPLPGFTGVNIQAGAAVGPGITLSSIRVVNFVNFFSVDESISGNSGPVTSSYDYGSVELEVRFNKTTKLETGANVFDTIERSVLVNVKRLSTGGGAISDCTNLADLTSLQLKQQICGVEVENFRGQKVMVGSFVPSDSSCRGIQESINWISAQKICVELGGALNASGTCMPFGSQTSTSCPNGFGGIVNGVPGCL